MSKARGRSQNWLNAVASKQEYIERLKLTVEHLHKCSALHLRTDHVHEQFNGATVWEGDVEVFFISGNPKAIHCYGWSHKEGERDEGERFVAVLKIPPVVSAETAVRASIMADGKSGYSK